MLIERVSQLEVGDCFDAMILRAYHLGYKIPGDVVSGRVLRRSYGEEVVVSLDDYHSQLERRLTQTPDGILLNGPMLVAYDVAVSKADPIPENARVGSGLEDL